mmetsp:Transcript_10072/g.20578  ORF Transcript_10072/g.20578 Transcript_10072/m.20578 type:complete len:462 (+) Transcript_10072:74-1459(+)
MSPDGDSKSKGKRVKSSVNVVLRRHGVLFGVIMLLIVPMYLLHMDVGVDDGGDLPSNFKFEGNSAITVTDLHDCQVHLQDAERAARSSLESVKRSNVVVEELSEKLRDCGGGGGTGTGTGDGKLIEIPPCPECEKCPLCPSCPVPVCPQGSGSGHAKKWLTVGIPTVPRVENHLGATLESWIRQLPVHDKDPLYDDVVLVVMNMHGQGHDWFYKAKEKYSGSHPFARYFRFTEETNVSPDPLPHLTKRKDEGDANHPGYKVRKQTRNIASLMKESEGLGDFYLFTEDDMQLCDHGLVAIQYMLNKAELYAPDFMTIRASYGMNGIIMRDEDISSFSDYLLEHQARRPPDHLVVEWFAGEKPQSAALKRGRKHMAFRYNILHHLGVVSTLRSAKSKTFPMCFEELGEPTLFEVEAFNFRQCTNDDVWPCNVENEIKTVGIPWGALCTGQLCLNSGNPNKNKS